jgi:hypothetical protein
LGENLEVYQHVAALCAWKKLIAGFEQIMEQWKISYKLIGSKTVQLKMSASWRLHFNSFQFWFISPRQHILHCEHQKKYTSSDKKHIKYTVE